MTKKILILLPLIILPVILLKTQKIECYTQFGLCTEELTSSISWLKNSRLLWPLPTKQVQRQSTKFSYIKSISLYRRLPSTLIVSVSVYEPLGAISSSVLGAQTVIDNSGKVYATTAGSQLPLLLTSNNPPNLTSQELLGLKIMTKVSPLSSVRPVGSLSGNILNIDFSPGVVVILDINKPVADWYAPLQSILQRSKISSQMPRVIDLRFSRPVLTQ